MPTLRKMVDFDNEINKLEQEILSLEKAVTEQENENNLKAAWQDFHQQHVEDDCDDVLRARVESLKHQIGTLKGLKGVSITDVITEIVGQEKLSVKKVKQVNGNCGQVEFHLKMHIEESMGADSTVQAVITHLSISTSECVYVDLKDIVERLAEEGNVQGFLSLLRPYNTWIKARQKTFEHFVENFPKIAESPSSQVLTLSHPVKKCMFEITWKFRVTEIYDVVPVIQLQVHIPNKVQNNSKRMLETVPEKFQLMLTELGIEATLNHLVTLLMK